MRKIHLFSFLLAACSVTALAEDVTVTATGNSVGGFGYSQTIILNRGDTAKLQYYYSNFSGYTNLECNANDQSFVISLGNENPPKPVTIAGPATFRLRMGEVSVNTGGNNAFATFQITRAGLASPPATIPQEAGTSWDVILESSSDLINWTPANPGQYSGTEPKRFFRTRIVKME